MTDEQLLEAAANATGRRWEWDIFHKHGSIKTPHMHHYDGVNEVDYFFGWYPLKDVQDAFELMLKLRMCVHCGIYDQESHYTEPLGSPKTIKPGEYVYAGIDDMYNDVYVSVKLPIEVDPHDQYSSPDRHTLCRAIVTAAAKYYIGLKQKTKSD